MARLQSEPEQGTGNHDIARQKFNGLAGKKWLWHSISDQRHEFCTGGLIGFEVAAQRTGDGCAAWLANATNGHAGMFRFHDDRHAQSF